MIGCEANSAAADRISHGTAALNESGQAITKREPIYPPTRLGSNKIATQRRTAFSSRRNPQTEASAPGTKATVLVALAITDAPAVEPSAANKAGNVNSVPPPAIELIAPAAKAERHSHR